MEIIVGKTAGFCYGVKRAVEGAERELQENNKNIYCLGEIVHNKQVIQALEKQGIKMANEIEEIPEGKIDSEIENLIKETYKKAEENIENLEFKAAVQNIMDLVEAGNKYYDTNKPWVAKKENIEEFNNIIYTCSVIIANLSNLFEPIMPTASQKIREYLNIQNKSWEYITIPSGLKLDKIEPLFERMK